MRTFLMFLLLFVVCWPVALFGLLLYPLFWLVLLPFRIAGVAIEGALELVRFILSLPVRALRWVVT